MHHQFYVIRTNSDTNDRLFFSFYWIGNRFQFKIENKMRIQQWRKTLWFCVNFFFLVPDLCFACVRTVLIPKILLQCNCNRQNQYQQKREQNPVAPSCAYAHSFIRWYFYFGETCKPIHIWIWIEKKEKNEIKKEKELNCHRRKCTSSFCTTRWAQTFHSLMGWYRATVNTIFFPIQTFYIFFFLRFFLFFFPDALSLVFVTRTCSRLSILFISF